MLEKHKGSKKSDKKTSNKSEERTEIHQNWIIAADKPIITTRITYKKGFLTYKKGFLFYFNL
ncbi:MAG: hypothetical protein DRR19_10655 [Candidatus Parabeggiatoa sp. nov. 1]|nr:MAG: hypothetical protein DRR19_10655 [Gammaproteobacteria bacterium]